MNIQIKERLAKKISYSGKRDLKDVEYIVIHYTGNKRDKARDNAEYFAVSNTRKAGANFFVDKTGEVYLSVRLEHAANAVGGYFTKENGAGTYYGKCNNQNSVSIELCDCTKCASWEQMIACREVIAYIKEKCPNAKRIIRHWDVNGKQCPAPMTGRDNKQWKHFNNKMTKNYQFKAVVKKAAAVRSSKGVKANNKIGSLQTGDIVKISKVVGNWGRLLDKKNGKWQWVSLKKVREI